MTRFLIALLLLIVVVALIAGGMSYLAYGIEALPAEAHVEGLEKPAVLTLFPDDGQPARIEAAGDLDAYRALGYAQAQEMTWTLLVWRQAAQARLGAWLGAAALPLDRHASRLGFGRGNSELLEALPESDRRALEAFAQGVSAGLRQAHRHDPFVAVLGVQADPYRAEDVLAVERLFAWCASSLVWPDSTELPAEARLFAQQDSLFRRAVGLFGWQESAGWTYRDTSRTVLTAQWLTGNSALPVIHESVRHGSADSTLALTIPGTPFPLMSAGTRAVAVLPRGQARLQPTSARRWRSEAVALTTTDDGVFVESLWRGEEALLLAGDTLSRSAWELVWPGLLPRTDASAWLRLGQAEAPAPAFVLLGAAVLTSTAARSTEDAGAVASYARGTVAAPAAALPWLRQRLDSLSVRRPETAPRWFKDARSTWAAALNARITPRLDSALLTAPHHLAAYDYLSNWRGDFDGASIGATVFEAYAHALGAHPGSGPVIADSAEYFAAVRHTRMLAQVADSLRDRHGAEPLAWRWEEVHPDERDFPLWSVSDALGLRLPPVRSFRAFSLPGEGHPTALRRLDLSPHGAGAIYAVSAETAPRPSWLLYRLRYDAARPFARSRTAGRRLQVLSVAHSPDSGHQISLIPDP